VNEIKAGASPEQAVKTGFMGLTKRTPTIAPAGKKISTGTPKTDDILLGAACNMDLMTLNLIKDAYSKHNGVVLEMEVHLKNQGVNLSRRRISKVLDAMNLPRLKRIR
jgi:hypothetical protein